MDELVKTQKNIENFYHLLRYISFSGLGIASFFIELAAVERLSYYQKNKFYQDKFSNFIIKYLSIFVTLKLIIFQTYNLYIFLYYKPLFLYAVIDYSLSLITTIIIYSLWLIKIKKIDKNYNNKFELNGIIGYILLIVVSFPFQLSTTIQ